MFLLFLLIIMLGFVCEVSNFMVVSLASGFGILLFSFPGNVLFRNNFCLIFC